MSVPVDVRFQRSFSLLLIVGAAITPGCAEPEAGEAAAGAPCETNFDCDDGEECVDRHCEASENTDLDAGSPDAIADDVPMGDTAPRPDARRDAVDAGDADAQELGLLGEPCDLGADCRSGFCIINPDSGTKICSDFCAEGTCDEGYACSPVADGADRVFLCFPEVEILCQPCELDTECGGLSDLCLDYDFARFCGQNCVLNECPEGYECVEMEGPDGATAQCRHLAGTCIDCEENTYDIDQRPENGCEYTCEYQGPEDVPDIDNIDANCDGIDGNIFESLFVSTSGSDDAPGTINAPMRTILAALDRAESNGTLRHVLVSEGTYAEAVRLEDGVSLWGGYSENDGWRRSASYQTIISHSGVVDGRIVGVYGEDIVEGATLGFVQVTTGDPAEFSVTNYGVYCRGCPALTLLGNTITSGPGSGGRAGAIGDVGRGGDPGGPGNNGSCNGGHGTGGTGGFSPCSHTGGRGGDGGSSGYHTGAPGGTGVVGTSGGTAGARDHCDGRAGGRGADGTGGGAGTNGPGGASGGQIESDWWAGNPGDPGSEGPHGNGGGGGGGGGGQGEDGCWLCIPCNNGGGNGGGGGGGAGCGGQGGGGGDAGGGSFGVFLVRSPGASLIANTIASSVGGRGGDGGTGGGGGLGAPGGSGATACTDEVGAGGRGGDGGPGGTGGQGGGGAGGDSFAIILVETALPDLSSNTLEFGTGGSGGSPGGEVGREGAYVEASP